MVGVTTVMTEVSITLVRAENVRNARAIQRSEVAVGAQAGVFIKRLPPVPRWSMTKISVRIGSVQPFARRPAGPARPRRRPRRTPGVDMPPRTPPRSISHRTAPSGVRRLHASGRIGATGAGDWDPPSTPPPGALLAQYRH